MRPTEDPAFAVLGPVEVRGPDGPAPAGRPGERALLALLLLRANTTLPPEEIISQLWGDQPPATAREQVHARVSALRRVLPDGKGMLATRAGGYVLDVAPDAVDLFRFTDGLARASAMPDPGPAVEALRSALALWRGEPFTGVDAAFVDRARRRLAAQRLDALHHLIQLELGLGRHAELTGELIELVDGHPAEEWLHRALMLALYRSDQVADAMRAYRVCRATLARWGNRPSPELEALANRILSADPALHRCAHDENPPRAGQERPGAGGEVRRAATASPGQHRHAERFTALDALLPEPATEPRIIVIHGPAEAGTSQLARAWADRVAGRFAGGVHYVDLTATPDPATVLLDLLGRFGDAVQPAEPLDLADLADLAARFRSAVHGATALFLLDNARDSAQVRPLLPGTGTCAVVVTSRDRLSGLVARFGARCHEVTADVRS